MWLCQLLQLNLRSLLYDQSVVGIASTRYEYLHIPTCTCRSGLFYITSCCHMPCSSCAVGSLGSTMGNFLTLGRPQGCAQSILQCQSWKKTIAVKALVFGCCVWWGLLFRNFLGLMPQFFRTTSTVRHAIFYGHPWSGCVKDTPSRRSFRTREPDAKVYMLQYPGRRTKQHTTPFFPLTDLLGVWVLRAFEARQRPPSLHRTLLRPR